LKRCDVLLLVMTMLLAPSAMYAADQTESVTVTPQEIDEILANPGIGWETFHRTSKADKNLPPWIPSTIRYDRWGWKVLEPEQGKIDYDFLDGVLKETDEAGQQLAFRVMCSSPYPQRITPGIENSHDGDRIFVYAVVDAKRKPFR